MPTTQPSMRGSWRIGTYTGIAVFVHWTFFLLPLLLASSELMKPGPLTDRSLAAGFSVLLIFAVFACVLLHEFGHAIMARRFGVRTRDIVLLPIGGVARLERIPRDPIQELWIALAGPAVNVVIACILGAGLAVAGLSGADLLPAVQSRGPFGFAATLLAVNLMLVVFNMIPAFPMDGGRVLRAVLALRMDYASATGLAARVGQVIAVVFLLAGLYFANLMLILVAAMVFMGASAEARQTRILARLAGLRVGDGMMTDFRIVQSNSPLSHCAELLLAGSQTAFPVVEPDTNESSGRYLGILTRNRLIEAISRGCEAEPAAEHIDAHAPVLSEDDSAAAAFEKLQAAEVNTAPVLREGELVGLVTIENIAELLDLRDAQHMRHTQSVACSDRHT